MRSVSQLVENQDYIHTSINISKSGSLRSINSLAVRQLDLVCQSSLCVLSDCWTFLALCFREAMCSGLLAAASLVAGIIIFVKRRWCFRPPPHHPPPPLSLSAVPGLLLPKIWLLQHNSSSMPISNNALNNERYLSEQNKLHGIKLVGIYIVSSNIPLAQLFRLATKPPPKPTVSSWRVNNTNVHIYPWCASQAFLASFRRIFSS